MLMASGAGAWPGSVAEEVAEGVDAEEVEEEGEIVEEEVVVV